MDQEGWDLLVCGGGVVGLSIAYQCAKQGWKVIVVDRGRFGRGASWAGAGILPAGATVEALDPIEQLRALSHRLHRQWAAEFRMLTGIDNEYRECGGVYLARTPAERATLLASEMWWEDHGIAYERITPRTSGERIAALARALPLSAEEECWWLPDDCRVRNPFHIDALVEANRRLGVHLETDREIVSIERDPGHGGPASTLTGRDRTGERIRANRVCITAGAWSRQLLELFGIDTGIMPVRGQMVLYKLDAPKFPFVINEGHRYLVPRDDGYLLAGSCEEEVGFDTSTTDSMIAELREWACSVLPDLQDARVERTWAGLRPGSFDSYPYMGLVPGQENLFVAAGHFRHGLHWSTGTAILMQQLMFGENPDIDLEPFRVLRGHNSK